MLGQEPKGVQRSCLGLNSPEILCSCMQIFRSGVDESVFDIVNVYKELLGVSREFIVDSLRPSSECFPAYS